MKTTTTKRKTTRRTTGLNGAVPEKKLTKKQVEFINGMKKLRSVFTELYNKGEIKHYDPTR